MDLRLKQRLNYRIMSNKGLDDREIIVNNPTNASDDVSPSDAHGAASVSHSNPVRAVTDTPLNTLAALEAEYAELELAEKVEVAKRKVAEKRRNLESLRLDTGPKSRSTSHNGEPINLGDHYSNKLYHQPIGSKQDTLLSTPSSSDISGPRSSSDANDLCKDLNRSSDTSALRMDLNPQSYLFSPKMEPPTKYRAIVAYIPKSARRLVDEEEEFEILPTVKLTTGKKCKLDSVTPAQWMAASACILAEVVSETPGDTSQLTRDYMAHVTKVGILATYYTWRSVIRWDDEYREKQHLHQFRWGSDSAHISTVQLVPRESPEQDKKKVKSDHSASNSKPMRSNGAPICFNWNKVIPCGRTPCRFRHVCEWCGSSDHQKVHHDDAIKSGQSHRA